MPWLSLWCTDDSLINCQLAARHTPAYRPVAAGSAQGTIGFPGCTFLSDSEVATNPDFSGYYSAIQYNGLNNTLSNLKTPATLFLPTNEALEADMITHNFTYAYGLTLPYFNSALEYYIAPDQAIMVSSAMQCLCCLSRQRLSLSTFTNLMSYTCI